MSWHFSQVLEEEFSAANSSDGGQSAPSNGTPTHGTFWSPDKTMDASKPSRSGMTYRPSTADHGEAVLMWCLAASHARTSPQLEKVPASKASEAVCGNTWRELSVKYCRASSSWRTHQCLWEEDLPPSLVTLPRWGMTRSGVLWERITPPLLTSETESGSSESWATPTTMDKLPPKSAEALHKEATQARPGRSKPANLRDQVSNSHLWPTAKASDGAKGSRTAEGAAREWARGKNKDLGMMVAMWPTPCASEARQGYQNRNNGKKGIQKSLTTVVVDAEIGGQLNPTWVEWLMGWPLGWTDCGASATDKFRQWLNSHGKH